ncbi:metal ABC transporter ATP-binding protein [Arthrobacter castelli]|uniref:metal ABC transporter ATP-binding protein n=1 Tax=Arthrobacter castelli TaxID=271431 RepID=UPI0003F7CD03|nr:metal ABC transporter ATP-binding protein [Arthrobacter castelli]
MRKPAPAQHRRPAREAGAAAPALNIASLTVRYADILALDRVSLGLEQGNICALVGVNGSGKSTLFKAIMGLVSAGTGTVRIFGAGSKAARKNNLLTYVPQSEDVDWTFPVSVHDVVMMGRYGRLGPTRRPHSADREAVDHALEQVGLTSLASRQIGELSGGQRKRAFVARGIAQQARLMLLDEPFAGVDKGSEATLTSLLQRLRADGKTILISTHDLAGIPRFCDEAVLLHRSVLAHGDPAEVLTTENLARAFGEGATSGAA